MRPNCQANAVIRYLASTRPAAIQPGPELGLRPRARALPVGHQERSGGTEVRRRRPRVTREGIICVWIRVRHVCRRRQDRGAQHVRRRARRQRRRRRGQRERKVVHRRRRLESRRNDFDLARKRELRGRSVAISDNTALSRSRTGSARARGKRERRTLSALESIFPTSCLFMWPDELNTVEVSSALFFFLRFPPPPAPGLMVLPKTSGRHQRPTAPSLWCRPLTESGSASVHVCGLFGRPDTT